MAAPPHTQAGRWPAEAPLQLTAAALPAALAWALCHQVQQGQAAQALWVQVLAPLLQVLQEGLVQEALACPLMAPSTLGGAPLCLALLQQQEAVLPVCLGEQEAPL